MVDIVESRKIAGTRTFGGPEVLEAGSPPYAGWDGDPGRGITVHPIRVGEEHSSGAEAGGLRGRIVLAF